MKPKVLILKNEISSYNVPVYNVISEQFDLTVAYFQNDKSTINCNFEKIKLPFIKLKSLYFVKGLRRLVKKFDVVSIAPDPHVPGLYFRSCFVRKYKVVTWDIGFRCSYTHPYQTEREHTLMDRLNGMILKKADANIFYMNKAKEFWRGCGLDFTKVFVAPNTTDVLSTDIKPELKKNVLFVGTLYRGKGFDLLLNSFKEAISKTGASTKLIIVGGGEMKDEIEQFIIKNNMTHVVELTGPIFDENILAKQFERALICVSPTQGGLTCPKSMGYGVPFVCRKDAMTGGEIYHMTSGVNGIMYDKDEDLTDILIDTINNPAKFVEMGIKAKKYYDNNATVRHMAQGAMDAYNYVLNCKK